MTNNPGIMESRLSCGWKHYRYIKNSDKTLINKTAIGMFNTKGDFIVQVDQI